MRDLVRDTPNQVHGFNRDEESGQFNFRALKSLLSAWKLPLY